MRRRSALAALAILAAGCVSSSRNKPASAAPDFELPTIDGRVLRLSNLRGRPVIVNFWATWCAPCRIETPWLVALYRSYKERVEFLGVSLDDETERRAVAEFAAEMRVAYPVLFGTPAVADAFGGVRLMPQTFYIDSGGTIVSSAIGITSEVEIDGAIRRLLAG